MKLQLILWGLLLFSLNHSIIAQEFSKSRIKKIAQKDGLASSKVNVIFKDSHNFVWLGTDNGLDRFDGKTINHFCVTNNCNGDKDNAYVKAIFETSDGRLWIGSKEGLAYFDRNSQEFISIDSIDLSVLCFTEDLDGNLIVGTESGAFILPKGKTEILSLGSFWDLKGNLFKNIISVSSAFVDSKGLLWLGVWKHGLQRIDPVKGSIESVSNQLGLIKKEEQIEGVLAIKEGPDGSIWAGGYESGLFRILPDRKRYKRYVHNADNPNSLNNDRIKSLSFDKRGYLWIGLEEGGLDRLAPEDEQFEHFLSGFQGNGLVEGYSVYSTFVDDQDQLWIGFRNDGIHIVPLFPSLFESIVFEEDGAKEEFAILSLWQEKDAIWAGIKGGLRRIEKRTKNYQNYELPQKASPLSITTWEDNHLLIGTMTGEIFLFDKGKGIFKDFLKEDQLVQFKQTKINNLYPFSESKLFIGSRSGTFIYNAEEDELKSIKPSWTHTIFPGPDESLWLIGFKGIPGQYFPATGKMINHEIDISGDLKAAAYLDNKLYLGTDLGLFEYNMSTKMTTKMEDIFPYVNNQVNAMLVDDSKNIWFSSVDGIVRLNTKTNTFRTFDNFDDIPDIRFRDEIAIGLSDKRLAFGGNGGLTILSPDDYQDEASVKNLEFTNILINDKPFQEVLNLEHGLATLDKLRLKRSQSNLSIEFSLLSYTNPTKHRYQYKMTGGTPGWTNLDNNKVDLINIPTGHHELYIRAADEHGNWTKEKVLNIRVLPALFLRWYFIAFYVLIAGALIYFAFKTRSNQLYMEKEFAIEHLKLENIREKAERETEFHNMRLMFFTNISHEFRTPLTLILAPLEKFIQKGIVPSGEHLKLMYKNAERLRRLIGQILDFRKMESGELRFEPTFGDIIKFSKECWNLFEPLAQQKNITFEFQSQEEGRLLWFDKDKYEKIIINLLSNAFKFTDSGQVTFSIQCKDVEENNTRVEIQVSDTGSGISEEDLPRIFDRFYNTKASLAQRQNGTGIGLSLVKELIQMHKGTIQVESSEEGGTSFIISLLLENINKSLVDPDHKTPESNVDPYMNLLFETTEEHQQYRPTKEEGSILPTILIVEDDADLRNYINVEFGKSFTIIEAKDGEDGLKQAFKYIPDLVISDVSMPVMDGLEMSETLKKDERTSHIPIVLLTAHGTYAHQKKGFQIGVEDFITKPFSSDILEIRINNLLQSRKDLQDKFSKEFKVEPSGLPVSSMDQTFLNRAMEVIEQNLNNPQFSAIVFAEEMCMSRVHLYRKLKALTNESVSGFVKVVRLKLAAELIRDKKMRIKEAAYTVGYSDPKYFSKCFKQQFGVNPSEYAEGAVEEDS